MTTTTSSGVQESTARFAWDLFVELRRELVESQKLRSQIIGFKITFVGAGVGVILPNLDKLSPALLVVPAFAAIFFDFLIVSYSFSIKRLGFYCRHHLEPVLRSGFGMPERVLLWQEFLQQPRARQVLSIIGNLGLSILVAVAAAVGVILSSSVPLGTFLLVVLGGLLALDGWAYLVPNRFRNPEMIGVDEESRSRRVGQAP